MNADRVRGCIRDEAALVNGQPPKTRNGRLLRIVTRYMASGRWVPRRAMAFGAVAFVVSVAALAALDAASPGARWSMLDLQIYRWAGLVVRHAGDLYGSRFPHYRLRFTYPPMAAITFAAVSAVPLAALKWIITAVSIASLVVTLWLTWGILGYGRSAARIGATLAIAGVALWLQPVQQTLEFGQVNLILMLIIVADFSLPAGAWAKGAGIGLAAGFKLTPLIFIPYLVLTRQFRMAMTAIVTFAVTIACSFVLLPGLSRQFWLGGLFLHSGRTGNLAYTGNQSLNGALARLMGGAQTAHPYGVAASVAVGILGLLIAAWWARHGHEMLGVLICALTGLLISPISWSHHWVWSAPALAVAVAAVVRAAGPLPWWPRSRAGTARPTARAEGPGWRRWAFWLTVTALVTPFYTLPQSLVPASVVQGLGARGAQLLTGNLYVVDGLVILCLAGLLPIARKARQDRAGSPSETEASRNTLILR